MKKRKIITFLKYSLDDPHSGGGEITLENTIRGLAGKSHEVYVIVGGKDETLKKTPNVTVHQTPAYKNLRPIDFFSAARWLKKTAEIKPEIIHSFYAESFLANLYGRLKGIPVVQEIHYADLHPYTLKEVLEYPKKLSGFLWAVHLRIAKLGAKSADIIITPSKYMKDKMIGKWGIKPGKIEVIPVGVNEDVFTIKKSKKEWDSFRILFVGRLVREKGLDLLLQSINKVSETHTNLFLTIVGEGPLRREYEKLAKELGINEKMSFVGWTSRENILGYFEVSDVLVVPSLAENFPRITLEGMGAGLPVIAASVGGIPEQITDGVDGILIEPASPGKLAFTLNELILKKEKMSRLRNNARVTASRYSIEESIIRLEGVYHKLLHNPGIKLVK